MYKGFKVIVLLVILITAVICGYFAGVSEDDRADLRIPEEDSGKNDPVESFREQRYRDRQMQIVQLNEIIQNLDTNQDIMGLAQKKLLELMTCSEKEIALEGMLSIRGFNDPLVIVQENSAHVFIRHDLITNQQVAVILDCVIDEMKISAGNVKIIPIK